MDDYHEKQDPRSEAIPSQGLRGVVQPAPTHTPYTSGSPMQPRLVSFGVPPRPFQYPSLGHLQARVDVACERMRSVEGLQPGSVRWMRDGFAGFRRFLLAARAHRRFLGGDLRVQVAVLEEWVAAMRSRGLSRSTINNYWRAVRFTLRRLETLDGVVNPLAFVQTPRVGRLLPRCLSRRAAEQLLSAVRNFDWRSPLERTAMLATIGLMLLAGLRRGEVLRLENADVDVDLGTIRVRAGKGPHGGKDRTAYAPPQLREILAAYRDQRRRTACALPSFLTLTGERPLGLGSLRRVFTVASKAVGEPVAPHVLRHSFATLLRQAGVPDRVAMDLLGHASLDMLQRYSHVHDGEHSREAAKLQLDLELGDP